MRWRRDRSDAQAVIRSNHVERRKGISDLERFSIGCTGSRAPVPYHAATRAIKRIARHRKHICNPL